MGERDESDRIRDLQAYLRGEVVRTAKGRPWTRGKEDLAREELARLLGVDPKTLLVELSSHVWVPAFDGPRCWGCECSPRSRAALGPCGCPRLVPQPMDGETGEDECGGWLHPNADEPEREPEWCPDPTTRVRR